MDRKPLKSSQIRSVGYDDTTKELEIEFQSGGVYSYAGVPEEVYDALLAAKSHGGYFATCIRANYECTRHHIEGCDANVSTGHEIAECKCWCHRLTKSTEAQNGATIPNPSLEKELKKSIKAAKAKKRIA